MPCYLILDQSLDYTKMLKKDEIEVRIFIKPNINFNADDYWLESVLTRHISTANLLEYI